MRGMPEGHVFDSFDQFEYDLSQNHRLLLAVYHSMKIAVPNISTFSLGILELNSSR